MRWHHIPINIHIYLALSCMYRTAISLSNPPITFLTYYVLCFEVRHRTTFMTVSTPLPLEETILPTWSSTLIFAVMGVLPVRQSLAIIHATKGLAVGDEEETLREVHEKGVKCAIQLVRLGVNVNVRVQLVLSSPQTLSLEIINDSLLHWMDFHIQKFQLPTGRDANQGIMKRRRQRSGLERQCGKLRLRRALNCWSTDSRII